MGSSKQSQPHNGHLELDITVELGRAKLPLEFLLNCTEGTLIQLPNATLREGGSHIADIRANGALAARGEVVVISENFGARITEVLAQGSA